MMDQPLQPSDLTEMSLFELRAEVRARLDALLRESSAYVVEGRYYRNHDDATRAFIRAEKNYLGQLDRVDTAIAAMDAGAKLPEALLAAAARFQREIEDRVAERSAAAIAKANRAIDDALRARGAA